MTIRVRFVIWSSGGADVFFIINNVGKNEKRLLHLCIQQLQGAAEATGGEGATTPRHRHGNAKIDLPLKIFRKIVFYHDGRL